jgi:hypothetical protein
MNIEYRDTYLADGGHNAMLKFPTAGGSWVPQLHQMESDLRRVLTAALISESGLVT